MILTTTPQSLHHMCPVSSSSSISGISISSRMLLIDKCEKYDDITVIGTKEASSEWLHYL